MAKKTQKKKANKADRSKEHTPVRKTKKIKAIIFLVVSLFFLAYMVYSGGTIVGYLALVVGLVCGLMGASYIYEGKKGMKPRG